MAQNQTTTAMLRRLSVDGGPVEEVLYRPSGLIRTFLVLLIFAALVYGALVFTGVT